jgi:hypothetical protein
MIIGTDARRRWRLRFSLKTFLLLVTAFAVWLGWNVYQVSQRQRMEQYARSVRARYQYTYVTLTVVHGPPTKPWKSLPFMWRLLGVKSVSRIDSNGGVLDKEDVEQIRKWFPEADIELGVE